MDETSVLVVEDDDNYRELLALALRAHHVVQRVYAFSMGRDALAALAGMPRERWPFVVLLDYHMPGLSGLDVLRRLLDMGYRGRVTVISRAVSPDESRICEAAGAAVLPKPTRYEQLATVVATLLASARATLAPPPTGIRHDDPNRSG